jgi:hypothetical protein
MTDAAAEAERQPDKETMKSFFFMGRNPRNRSGVSWKIWKIRREGRTVTATWGPARLQGRRLVLSGEGTSRRWRLSSEELAESVEASRIREKLGKGYERRTRRR